MTAAAKPRCARCRAETPLDRAGYCYYCAAEDAGQLPLPLPGDLDGLDELEPLPELTALFAQYLRELEPVP